MNTKRGQGIIDYALLIGFVVVIGAIFTTSNWDIELKDFLNLIAKMLK